VFLKAAIANSVLGIAILVGGLGVPSHAGGTRTYSTQSGEVQQSNHTIFIDGFIDRSTEDCFRGLSKNGIDTLEVRSSGGEPEPSLNIAELLSNFRPKIVIHDFCGSACAYLLLPTASKIEASPNSIVLFHHTSTSTFESLSQTDKLTSKKFGTLRRRELALYAKLGVSPWLLRAPFAAQGATCEMMLPGKEPSYVAHYKAVLVDKAALSTAGLRLPSSVPGTPSELEDIINTFRDKGDDLMRGGIAYLSVPVGSDLIRNGPGTLHALPRCE
jgi:hypothetical protein